MILGEHKMEFRQVCLCEIQPCWICFLIFDLHIKEINLILAND